MNASKRPRSAPKDAGEVHRLMKEQLLAQPLPPRRRPRAASQWALWLLLCLLGVGMVVWVWGGRPAGPLGRPGVPGFLLLGLAALALSSWQAFASSIPGRENGRAMVWTVLTLCLLAGFPLLMPLFGSSWAQEGGPLAGSLPCIVSVLLMGLPAWLLLGWTLSRNASPRPVWTGAWSGLAAFLVGALGVQLQCPDTHPAHILFAHLLPAAAAAVPAALIGGRWFSRWRR